jgi:hypothetical protein
MPANTSRRLIELRTTESLSEEEAEERDIMI